VRKTLCGLTLLMIVGFQPTANAADPGWLNATPPYESCDIIQACLLRPGCMEAMHPDTADYFTERYLEDC
jgi:hypothetical protein